MNNYGMEEILRQRKINGNCCDEYLCKYYGKSVTNNLQTNDIIGEPYCNLFNCDCYMEYFEERIETNSGIINMRTQSYRVPSCISLDELGN